MHFPVRLDCEHSPEGQLPPEAKDEPLASLLERLRARKQQMLEKKQSIRVIQQVVICPKCGVSSSADSGFCTSCGTSLQEAKSGVFCCPGAGLCKLRR